MKTNLSILKFVFTALLALGLLAASVFPALAITNPQIDSANVYSSVGVMWLPHPQGGIFQRCSGMLIDSRVFLTAGQCTYFTNFQIQAGLFNLNDVKVSFDPLGSTSSSVMWDVETMITHPGFKIASSHLYDDIGVIILKQNPGLPLVNLPTAGYLDQLKAQGVFNPSQGGAGLTVVGYGAELNWPPPRLDPSRPERMFTDIVLQSLTSNWIGFTQHPATGGSGLCYGDFGGPTFWTEPGGRRVAVGLNAWITSGNCNGNGFSYRLDLPEIQSFIQSVLSQY
jgi:secreted trypsin-like serine protease